MTMSQRTDKTNRDVHFESSPIPAQVRTATEVAIRCDWRGEQLTARLAPRARRPVLRRAVLPPKDRDYRLGTR